MYLDFCKWHNALWCVRCAGILAQCVGCIRMGRGAGSGRVDAGTMHWDLEMHVCVLVPCVGLVTMDCDTECLTTCKDSNFRK